MFGNNNGSLTSAQRGSLESLALYFPTAGQEDLLACLRAQDFNFAAAKAQYEREQRSRGTSMGMAPMTVGNPSYTAPGMMQQPLPGVGYNPGLNSGGNTFGAFPTGSNIKYTGPQDVPDSMKSAAQLVHEKHLKWEKLIEEARITWTTKGGGTFQIFFVLHTALNWGEPFLVGFGAPFDMQLYIVLAAIGLFFVGLFKTASYIESTDVFPVKVWLSLDGEVQFEAFFLIYGILSLLFFPGYAPLRLFRSIRVMWFVECFQVVKEEPYYPENHFFSIMSACRLCLAYIEAVHQELLSDASRGGIVVLLMFFFMCYVDALVAHSVAPDITAPIGEVGCADMPHCFMTLMRLSFFDGHGFDYMTMAYENNLLFLFWILFFHMCFTALILLNGLIGIFGSAFTNVHDEGGDDDPDGVGGGNGGGGGGGGFLHHHLHNAVNAHGVHLSRLADEVRKLAANNRAVEKLLRDQREILEDEWRERDSRHRR
jgi:hypothetical protein